MPKIHDITVNLTEDIMVWPETPKPNLRKSRKIEDGDMVNITLMDICVHTGTHVEAPSHFLKNGETVEMVPLDALIGRAIVLDMTKEEIVTDETLREANIPAGTERLLIKTRNSKLWQEQQSEFDPNYVAITTEGAQYLVEKGIKLIGIDSLSIAPFDDLVPGYELLLKSGVVIVVGLNLFAVKAGEYMLYCLPLKIEGSDGAPARAIIIE